MDFMHVLFALVGIAGGFGLGWMVLSARLAGIKGQLGVAARELQQAQSERTGYHERAIKAETQVAALEQRAKEQQAQLKVEFQNTANKIFEEVSTKFTTQSEKKIGDLLNPLRERLGEFQKLVGDSFTAQKTEQNSLKEEIGRIMLQADSLTKALRGDVKAQGNWGEVMLERILEESGLQKGLSYVVQGVEMSLSGAEGNRLRPDVIVKLPDNKHIIIDSKVSLTAYERYCSQPEEVHARDFLRSIRSHVNGLEQKRYQDIEKLGTPDFVFMFMPIEGAFSFAIQNDPELQPYAWGKNVTLVSPNNLLAALKTIASLWRIEQQNRNAEEIAKQGSALYDKFVGFLDDMQALGRQMNTAQKSYDAAMNKLSSGRGNLVGASEKLRQLGVKASRPIPQELIEEERDQPRLSVAND